MLHSFYHNSIVSSLADCLNFMLSSHTNTVELTGIFFVVIKALESHIWKTQYKLNININLWITHRPLSKQFSLEVLSTEEIVPIRTFNCKVCGLFSVTRTMSPVLFLFYLLSFHITRWNAVDGLVQATGQRTLWLRTTPRTCTHAPVATNPCLAPTSMK